MNNCKLTIEVTDGKINITAEHTSMVELAILSGYLQSIAGFKAYQMGKDIEDIKDNMLDIHLGAMDGLVQDIKKMESECEVIQNGKTKEDEQ